jgi:hypothetical protein
LSILQQAFPVEFGRVLEEKLMHFPEFALVPGGQACLCGDMGIVPVFVRIVLDDQAYLSLVVMKEFFDDRTGRGAVRSLVIEKLHNGNRRIVRPQGR